MGELEEVEGVGQRNGGMIMKRIIASIEIIMVSVLLVLTAYAAPVTKKSVDNSSIYIKEVQEIQQKRAHVCPKCQTDFMYLVCMGDENHKGTKYHSTLSGECTYYQYSSRSVYICGTCQFAESVEGEHYCLDRHTVCSKGDYYCCPCEIRY